MLRLLLCCVLLALAACSKPQPPEKERPVEPQATYKPQDGLGNGKTGMPAMIQVPVDQARKIQEDAKQAEEKRQEIIDEAEGG